MAVADADAIISTSDAEALEMDALSPTSKASTSVTNTLNVINTSNDVPGNSISPGPVPSNFDGSSSSGVNSDPYSSQSSSSVGSLTGAKYKFLDIACFLSFHSTRIQTFWWLRGPVLILNLLQVFSFVLDDRFFHNSGYYSLNVLRGLRHLRNPTLNVDPETHSIACVVPIAVFCFSLLILTNIHMFMVQKGILSMKLFIFGLTIS